MDGKKCRNAEKIRFMSVRRPPSVARNQPPPPSKLKIKRLSAPLSLIIDQIYRYASWLESREIYNVLGDDSN